MFTVSSRKSNACLKSFKSGHATCDATPVLVYREPKTLQKQNFTSVFGRYISWTPLAPSSVAHQVQARLSYLQGDAHWYSTLPLSSCYSFLFFSCSWFISYSNLLQVLHTNLIFGSRCFRAAAPTIWNSLPDSLRLSNTFQSSRLSCDILKHTFNSKQLLIPPSGIPSPSDSLM